MVAARRKDLDAWAQLLDVTNDADAMAALRSLHGRLLVIAGELNWFQNKFSTSGVLGGDGVMVALHEAATGTLEASEELWQLRRSFERHDRGVA